MSIMIYRHPNVDPEVLAIISENYYIDAQHLVVLSREEHHFHPNASLTYLIEGYIACTLSSRQMVFWYQMMHFPHDENEWQADVVPFTNAGREVRGAKVNLVYGEPMPKLPKE